MKKAQLLLVSLLSIGLLASCDSRSVDSSSEESSAAESSAEEISSEESSEEDASVFSTSIEDDPYAAVLEGLDTTNGTQYETYYDSKNEEIGGAYGYANGSVGYGWIEYESYGSSYGVAIAVTFDDNHEATAVEIGAPADGTHNYTPYYAMSFEAGYAEYLVYLANVESAVEGATIGLDAAELYTAFADSEIDPTASTYTPGESLVGAGCTQTDARLGIAIKYAAEAYIVNMTDPSSEVISALELTSADAGETAASKGVLGTGVAYGGVYYTSWGAYYGAAVAISYDSSNVITGVEVGVPFEEAHNFTPSYKASAPVSYYNYVINYAAHLSAALVGQTINSDLANIWSAGELTTYTSASTLTVDAGATQTYARATVAVYAALQAVLG